MQGFLWCGVNMNSSIFRWFLAAVILINAALLGLTFKNEKNQLNYIYSNKSNELKSEDQKHSSLLSRLTKEKLKLSTLPIKR